MEENSKINPYLKNLQKYNLVPSVLLKLCIILEEKLRRLEEFSNETDLNYIEYNDKNIGINSPGIDAVEA